MTAAVVLPAGDAAALAQAVRILSRGGVVAFPTDTVYGVGAPGFNPAAVAKLYAVKDRPRHMAIPLLLGRAEDVATVTTSAPPAAWMLIRRYWPGALTLVLRRSGLVPNVVTAGGDTVAVRLPDHAVPRALAGSLGMPLAATSANLSGRRSPVTAAEVLADLGDRVELILDGGPCPGGVDSTIVDLTGERPRMLRQGAISRQEIEGLLGRGALL